MLDIMRKNASSLMIKIIFSIIVIVFVFWGVGSFQENAANRVALVNGEEISFESYRNAYNNFIENLKSQYGDNINQEILEMFQVSTQVISSLVNRELMVQEAEKLNLRVTDEELASEIQNMAAFQENGVFNKERYEYLIARSNLTQELFEVDQRETMLMNKLYAFITSGIKVTDDEIQEWYEWINATVDIDYISFDPNSISDIAPVDEDVMAFYDINKENYRTQPRIAVQYLSFRPDHYATEVMIDDDAVQAYYTENMSEYETEKTVEARHILLSVEEDAEQALVDEKRQKIEEILVMAREGKDFADLAKEYSEGATQETGGLLGEFKEGDMVAPFSEAAFSMEEGEISDPVRTQFGWHIIKVEKINAATVLALEDVSDQIRSLLVEKEAEIIAYDVADEAFDMALGNDDLMETAEALGMEVHTTDYFTAVGPESGVSDPQTFAAAAFELSGSDVSDVLSIGDNYYILQKTGEIPSEIPALEDIGDQVRSDLIAKLKDEQALKNAESALVAARDEGGIENIAEAFDREMKNTGSFKRSDSISDIGYASDIIQASFLLSDDDKLADEVFQANGAYYVVQLHERTSPDVEELETQKDTIQSQLLSQKQQILFSDWLEKISAESEITIEDGYLD